MTTATLTPGKIGILPIKKRTKRQLAVMVPLIRLLLARREKAEHREHLRQEAAPLLAARQPSDSLQLRLSAMSRLDDELAGIDEDLAHYRKPAIREARRIIDAAESAAGRALSLGGRYSGETTSVTTWESSAGAGTRIWPGERYTRQSHRRRNDAEHSVRLEIEGAICLADNPHAEALSRGELLPLIALYPDGRAVWVRSRRGNGNGGNQIRSEEGWIAVGQDCCGHSLVSMAYAKMGLARKINAMELVRREVREAQRGVLHEQRRLRRLARWGGNLQITLADAKELHYCDPGIREFQARYRIGDQAAPEALLRTGSRHAELLVLHVARKSATARRLARRERQPQPTHQ